MKNALVCLTALLHLSSSKLYPYEPRSPLEGIPAPQGSIWPQPYSPMSSAIRLTFDPATFQLTSTLLGKCDPLDFAVQKYNNRFLFPVPANLTGAYDPGYLALRSLDIRIIGLENGETECSQYPKLNEDSDLYEHYELVITIDGIGYIEAETVWGALRGIETFSQTIWNNDNYATGPLHFYTNATVVIDLPRFPHRGLMVDSARHYLPERIFYDLLDGMMYNKLNVFHWHITDDQSFPYVSRKFPDLSAKGAYHPKMVYSPEMVQRVIEAGRLRGIRIILEFDTPGHTQAFGEAYPELLTPCYGDGSNAGTPNPPHHAARENFDPTNPFVYSFMSEFFSEVVQNVSKDSFIHIGMDEVYTPCWESSPEILAFMVTNNYSNISQVQEHYTERHVEMIKSLGASPIAWQDPLDAGVKLDKGVVVHVWKDWNWQEYLQTYIRQGYKAVLSGPWYINYISYGESWKNYYLADPIKSLPNITEAEKKLILGGEACMWGEFVDKTNILARLFPSISPVAERLWSHDIPIDANAPNNARNRLDIHRCRMLQRGLPVQPILNGFCGPWEIED